MERVEKMANSYSKELKAEVILLALKNEMTVNEISERFSVSLDRVREWRNEALNSLKFANSTTIGKRFVIYKTYKIASEADASGAATFGQCYFEKSNFVNDCL